MNHRILLLENINPLAEEFFTRAGFSVDMQKTALPESELVTKLKDYGGIGIRSKTELTQKIFLANPHLTAVGCFCVGTNQVDLQTAKKLGIPVFNAPFSNTRSVAELVISHVIALARKVGLRNREMHEGTWKKESADCFEVRGKTLGIIGYGNVGSQLSMLAEAIGMNVQFYDVVEKLPLGNARPVNALADLLGSSHFISLHVPETPYTKNMLGVDEIAQMQKGAFLINTSRGTVIDLQAASTALKSGHLGGVAIDVFPVEPEKNSDGFLNPLTKMPNAILTPHIGGATEEAQTNIGREVANAMIRYFKLGSTPQAVQFPHLDLPAKAGAFRYLNIHQNVPGVLKEIDAIISATGANILAQSLATDSEIGYVVTDLNQPLTGAQLAQMNDLKNVIKAFKAF